MRIAGGNSQVSPRSEKISSLSATEPYQDFDIDVLPLSQGRVFGQIFWSPFARACYGGRQKITNRL